MSRIAGVKQWNRLGRKVKAGEKGIMILASITLRKKTEGTREGDDPEPQLLETITLFKNVYVFDISHTIGEPVPSIIKATGDASTLYPALQEVVKKAGIAIETVERIPFSPGARGASLNGRILLRSDLGPAEALRCLIHEWVHERIHWEQQEETAKIQETEADATAYIVCKHFNINCDTSDYLLLHHSSPDVLLSRLETIRKAAHHIINAIETEATEKDKQSSTPPTNAILEAADSSSLTGEDEESSEAQPK